MILKLLLIVIVAMVAMIIIWGIKKVIATRDAAWRAVREKAITDKINAESHLLDLSKEQYDWLRDNGLTVTQTTHDHFYPPYRTSEYDMLPTRQPLDRWGVNALDLEQEWVKRRDQRPKAIDYSNVTVDELLGATVIRVGTPPRAIVMDANGVKPVQEWKPWIDTERIKG